MKISERKDLIDRIESCLNDARLQWNQYLVDIEDFKSLQTDLESLFSRIKNESEQYKLNLKQTKLHLVGFNKFFALVLDNEVVSKDYSHMKTSFVKHREKAKAAQKNYTQLKN